MANGTQTVEKAKWLQLYKPNQGHRTRMITAIAAGAMVLWGASWIFDKLSVYHDRTVGLYIQVAGALLFIALFGALTFWLVGKKPTTVDFLVAVEGEMKKVNWSSWPEVIGATKVVIVFVFLLGFLLTLMDIFFMKIFSWMDVLKVG